MADFSGDLDLTLGEARYRLSVVPINDEVSSHALMGVGGKVAKVGQSGK
jgi:hypothetical protein